ncbi:EYxxD motif small membrane protein [Neobacillus kokaensis]
MDWFVHSAFVYIVLIGGIIAIFYAFRRRSKNRAR